MIQLICIDVDGTLVGSAGGVLPEVWAAVERVRARGVRFAIASGRPGFGTTRDYAERLEPGGWHIFQNGASVFHLASGASRSARMAPETLALLVERARAKRRVLELYGDCTYVVEMDAPVAREHAGLLGVPYGLAPFEAITEPVIRAQWLLDMREADAVLAEPYPGINVSPSTSPLMPDNLFVNLTMAGVDKAAGVRQVAEAYGIDLADVMMVGDGANDATAMRMVGHGVAMGNAEREALDAARHVVGHVDAAGLIEALELAA